MIKACKLICLELGKRSQDNKLVPYLCSLIGREGETIEYIRKTTDCSVILATDSFPGSSDRLATVSGSSSGLTQCLKRIRFILSEFPAISRKDSKYYKHSLQKSKLAQGSEEKSPNPLVSILALGEVISPKVIKGSSVSESIKMTISEKNIGTILQEIQEIKFLKLE